jgi:hypothetical protein
LYDLELIRKVCTKINEAESQREHNALDALLEAIAKNDEAEVRIRAGCFAKRCMPRCGETHFSFNAYPAMRRDISPKGQR